MSTAPRWAREGRSRNSAPFERSRVALRMAGGRGSPLVPVLAAAAAVVLGLALGAALLGQRGQDPGGVASSPTPTGSPATTTAPTASPPPAGFVLPQRVYFARDQLPPVGVVIDTTSPSQIPASEGGPLMAAARAKARLEALAAVDAPQGLTNVVPSLRTKPAVSDVRIDGDLVTVDYAVPNGDWGISGSAATLALLQQLVYTATEEPGIHRVLITENGGRPTTIDQVAIDAPQTRDDFMGYSFSGAGLATLTSEAEEVPAEVVDWRASADDLVPGMGRFVVELRAVGDQEFFVPRFTARLERQIHATLATPTVTEKWVLRLEMPDAVWRITPGEGFHCCPFRPVERTPIRRVSAYPLSPQGTNDEGVGFAVALDDARPWRISFEPGSSAGTVRLIADIGGHPQAISDSIAVYAPAPATEVARTFTLAGAARAVEAQVSWRIKDSSEREVATGFATASLGTSPVWGTFTTEVNVPDNVSGVVTLEVFWASPRDGAEMGTVAIPLRVR